MATGRAIESIWSGDVVTWYLPTNYKDVPYPPCGVLKAWAVDAGLRDGDKIVLHHVASAGDVVSRPDSVRDRAIGIRRTTKTASMNGYMVVATPEWAQLPTDMAAPGPTSEWKARRGVGSVVGGLTSDDKSGESLSAEATHNEPIQHDIPEGAIAPNECPTPNGVMTADEVVAACGGTVVDSVVQVPLTNSGDSRIVIEEPTMEPAHTAIDMIARGEGEVELVDAASYLRITHEQVEQLIDEGALTARQINGLWWVDATSMVKQFLKQDAEKTKVVSLSGDDKGVLPAFKGRFDEPATTLPQDDDCNDLACFAALDNANERLHGDIARMNIELSTLCQCLGRLQGVIEVKTGVDVSDHMGDPVALTKALIAALTQSHKPYIGAPIATTYRTEDTATSAAVVMQPKPDIRHDVYIGGNEIVATSIDVNTGVKKTAFVGDQLFDRAKKAGDDLKVMLHEMDAPRAITTSEADIVFDDINKNHHELG